ncbi:DUF3277 family protein [Scandinavium goeteborgense]|uniref:DUF3277 family protein n=1 Tax=Scandinavium goeteborgense TaxID=1851514 RepID=UPI0021652C9D|nr:DUF3277 family protein [Scandinavium goeteborgense]MCS2154350.1 DUF3277 family protein [Scandinavium goeteborgense]
MAYFDIKQVNLSLNTRAITGLTTDNDAITLKSNKDAGAWTMGANGSGVWTANSDTSGTLTLKLVQNHPDNAWLSQQFALQRNDLRAFMPFALVIRDLLNNDLVMASNGMFSTPLTFTRGAQPNVSLWTIAFESVQLTLAPGYGN